MYLIDANVLIEAKNRYYAFDLAPGFWVWLEQAHQRQLLGSVVAVREELLAGDDDLADWAHSRHDFFHDVDRPTARTLATVARWVEGQQYTHAAVAEFLGGIADFYLVADGLAHGATVVTRERSDPLARRRVMIPNVCDGLGVAYCDPFAMMRATGAILDLRSPWPLAG